nr:CbtA family protein [Rhodococcus trifolii]
MPGSFVQLLLRGLLAGLIAGILAGGVAFFIGEPHVDAAIAIEDAAGGHSHGGEEVTAAHDEEETPLVSRDGQKVGLFLATGLAGLALGAIFAVVVHYARRFVTLRGPVLALVIAGGGWLAIEAVPFFKYPANPPAVGDPDTITQRTWLWLASVVLGLLAVVVAAYVSKLVAAQSSIATRIAAPLAGFLVVVIAGYVLLPGINEVGTDFPATLLWQFRISSLTIQATLWISLGLAFAYLTERATRSDQSRSATALSNN